MSLASTFIEWFEPQLSALLDAIRRFEEYLGPEDDWIEDDRRYLFEWADTFLRPLGRPTVSRIVKEDYITTVDDTPDEIEKVLHPKYHRNLLSMRKYREHHSSGKQWAVGSYAFDTEDTEWQHHVVLFENKSGTDIYGHEEATVRDPSEHHRGEQQRGDPNGRLPESLSQDTESENTESETPDTDDETESNDEESNPDDDSKESQPPPESDADEESECDEAEWDDAADETIEISINYVTGHEEAAMVARSYVEYGIADAFGDEYAVDVFVGEAVSPDAVTTLERQSNVVPNLDREASDVNHFIGKHAPDGGGGSTSSGGNPGPLTELDADCVSRSGHGDRHYEANMVLHEVGHAMGMSHKENVEYPPVHPMATSYVTSTPYVHEFHEDSIDESDY